MSLILGELFTEPLHIQSWQRPGSSDPGSNDFRVTNTFEGEDLVNGGKHEATDVGNASIGYDILAPADCIGYGLLHFDTARGIRFLLGGGWELECWHLSQTLYVPGGFPKAGTTMGPPQELQRGKAYAKTGNSGSRVLIKGVWQPMPAHTHIKLTRNGTPVNAEAYLKIVERKQLALEGAPSDMGTFKDVKESDPHYSDIEWAAKNGISGGIGGGNFGPDMTVPRKQMVTFLRRLYDLIKREGR